MTYQPILQASDLDLTMFFAVGRPNHRGAAHGGTPDPDPDAGA